MRLQVYITKVSFIGAAGLPVDQVVQAFDQAINSFIARKPTKLKQIDIVIFDQNLLPKFRSKINSKQKPISAASASPLLNVPSSSVDEKSSPASKETSSNSRLQVMESKDDRNHRVKLYFTSNSTINNKNVSWLANNGHCKFFYTSTIQGVNFLNVAKR